MFNKFACDLNSCGISNLEWWNYAHSCVLRVGSFYISVDLGKKISVVITVIIKTRNESHTNTNLFYYFLRSWSWSYFPHTIIITWWCIINNHIIDLIDQYWSLIWCLGWKEIVENVWPIKHHTLREKSRKWQRVITWFLLGNVWHFAYELSWCR